MSFTRLSYDKEVSETSEKESYKQFLYNTQVPFNNHSCYQSNPLIHNQKNYRSNSNIDAETELFNINKRATKCPTTNQYSVNNSKIGSSVNTHKKSNSDIPDCYFPTMATRLTNPCYTLKEYHVDRFENLRRNPQDHVFFEGRQNVNTRAFVKDNYRSCLRSPSVNNMDP